MRNLFYSVILIFGLLSRLLANDSPLPDPRLTPGESEEGVTVEQLQEAGYSKHHRHVSEALRRAVFAEYGIAWEKRNDYEVDHLVSLSIGGSNGLQTCGRNRSA
jgi:hypothetical protein